MTSADLTPEQARRLKERVRRELLYMSKLCGRLQVLRFPIDDPLVVGAMRARDALQDLHVACHCSGCKSGVGRA